MKKRSAYFVLLSFFILFLVSASSSFSIDREDVSSLGCSDGIVNVGDRRRKTQPPQLINESVGNLKKVHSHFLSCDRIRILCARSHRKQSDLVDTGFGVHQRLTADRQPTEFPAHFRRQTAFPYGLHLRPLFCGGIRPRLKSDGRHGNIRSGFGTRPAAAISDKGVFV